MSAKKVLIVEDEKDIVEFLKYNLEIEKFEVITAHDGEAGLEMLSHNPDIVLLDIMLPKLNGYEVCREIRANKKYENLPVVFLTAKTSEADEVKGLELGANDYIQKPISPKKLIAKINTTLRNSGRLDQNSQKDYYNEIGPLKIDKEKYVIRIDETEKVFPRKEFELLFFLSKNPGIVFSRDNLLKEIWGTEVYVVDRTVDVHIRKVREKLGHHADLIETVKGVGYRFKEI
ncbi:MAG: response regulator transcription factor [Ignavibacteriaceae bacterium]|nr:response regulator transcription factor [Ignavibacteriaceae bacterium]